MPVNLRGGPLKRPAACGSGSVSYSANSCGIKLDFTPMLVVRLEEPEDGFDSYPGRDGVARGIVRGNKFPSSNRLHRALVEP
jgi:hypothetical protein